MIIKEYCCADVLSLILNTLHLKYCMAEILMDVSWLDDVFGQSWIKHLLMVLYFCLSVPEFKLKLLNNSTMWTPRGGSVDVGESQGHAREGLCGTQQSGCRYSWEDSERHYRLCELDHCGVGWWQKADWHSLNDWTISDLLTCWLIG